MFERSSEIIVREQFGRLLHKYGLLGEALEIGTYRGDFAIDLLANWDGHRLHVIDSWINYEEYHDNNEALPDLADARAIFFERTMPFGDRIEPHFGFSSELHGDFANESLDFVYIDANHYYEFVKQDLRLYWPKVKPGGILAGHDFEEHGPWADETRRAVLEFAEELGLDGFYCSGDAYSWYIFKPQGEA